jgi:ferritin-like metal-binding protein YciE
MKLVSITVLLEELLGELYETERSLAEHLPGIINKICHPALSDIVRQHFNRSSQEIERLQSCADIMHCSLEGVPAPAINALIDRLNDFIEMDGYPAVRDAAILAVLRQIQRYELSLYQSARELAALLGIAKIVSKLQATWNEEEKVDATLSDIATRFVYPDALQLVGEHWQAPLNRLERVSYRR